MKNLFPSYSKPFLLIILLTVHCSLFTIHSFAQQGQWTWMNGTSANNSPAVFGTIGTYAIGNTPPSVSATGQWTDHNGNFWLFGGIDDGNNQFQDLWEF